MKLAMWLYHRLARAFPHEFQMVYGADVIQLGEDIVQDIAERNGFMGLFRLIADIAVRVPMEYFSEMRRDLVYACRTLAKSRGFAAVGIISLGLGIGITAVGVSEVLNLLLRDAPGVREADRLVMINVVSYPYIERYRDQHDLFTGVAGFQPAIPYNVAIGTASSTKAERVFGQLVSPDYFQVIGTQAARGRVFSPDVDKPGSPPLVFVSDRFWRERLDSDPNVIGRTIRVNGQSASIIGVGPQDFAGAMPFIPSDIFVPTTAPESMAPELAGDAIHQRDTKTFNALFRLAPGVTEKSAEAGLDAITRNLDAETLDPARNAKGRRVTVLPGGKIIPIPRSVLPLTLGFAFLLNGMIVGLACMNLANMQLARAMARRKEVAVRLSVGASRFRLIRQLLTESVLLACIGGAVGILLAFWAARLFLTAKLPFQFPVKIDITPDWRVVAVVFLISLVSGVGFGLAPALAATKTDLSSTLKEGAGGQGRGYRRFGLRNLLMVGQVAGALSLLLLAGFMVFGFNATNKVDVAFDPATMYLFSIDPVRDGYKAEKAAMFFDNLTDRLKHVPGVQEVALTEAPPFTPLAAVGTLSAPSNGSGPDQVVSGIAENTVGPSYFAALSVPPVAGREFEMRDQRLDPSREKALPAVLNQAAALAFFGASDPLGRRLLQGSKSYEVIGVVKNLSAPLSATAVGQAAATSGVPVIYTPLTKREFAHPPGNGMIVMIRTDRADAMESVRRELAAIDPNLAMFNLQSLSASLNNTVAYLRFSEFVYGGIGVFGLVLAAIGLSGVTAYSVARRRKEIGIRMALGAKRGQVLRLVLREGGWLVLIGSFLGLLGATALSRIIAAFSSIMGPSFAAGAHDPRLLVGAPVLLATLAMLACYLPARRSMQIDPLKALREE